MTEFLLGVVIGFFSMIAWINRAWVMDKLSGWKWIDK